MSELLKSGKVGYCSSIEETLEIWSKTGLLDGLTHLMEIKVAVALENAAKILLLDKSSYETNFEFDVLVFPVIRRCMSGIEQKSVDNIMSELSSREIMVEFKKIQMLDNFDVKLVMDMLYKNYQPLMEIMVDLFGPTTDNLDMQAEVTAQLCEMMIFALSYRTKYSNK